MLGSASLCSKNPLWSYQGSFRRTVGQARQIFRVLDRLGVFAAALRGFGEQREVEALDRLAAFEGQFGADAAFIFEAGNFVAAGAAVSAGPTSCLLLSAPDHP